MLVAAGSNLVLETGFLANSVFIVFIPVRDGVDS